MGTINKIIIKVLNLFWLKSGQNKDYPIDLKYTTDHVWLRLSNNEASLGLCHHAQKEIGDIVFLEIETVGKKLKKDEVIGTIEAVKTVTDLYMPISGTVLELNPKLKKAPELINNDPYGEGWIVRISIEDKSDLEKLMSASEYKALIEG